MGPMAWMVCEFDLVQEAAPLDVFILVEQGSPPFPPPRPSSLSSLSIPLTWSFYIPQTVKGPSWGALFLASVIPCRVKHVIWSLPGFRAQWRMRVRD